MQIKVFKAGNMKDAMAAMKAELGEDAVILHSKKYKEGGILGIGSREVVEITAAVEESSMPKKVETPRLKHPTVATSSVLSRYKTDGTAQAVEDAQRTNENLDTEESARPLQLDKLAEKVSEQKKSLTAQDNFEHILQETQENSLSVNLTAKDEEIRNEELGTRNEETPAQIEESPPVEETSAPEEISQPVEETPVQEETPQPVEEMLAPEETSAPVEETPATEETLPVEETPAVEEKPQLVVEISKPEEISQPVETPAPEEKSQAEETPQQVTGFTQEQMAQTQAMIMAQFNQMQMMQQAAIAQAQAQAAEQIRLQQEAAAQAQQAAIAQAQVQPVINQSEEKLKRLEEEIAQMKALLAEILGRESKPGTISLHEALKRQEVDEDILKEMAASANPGDTLVDMHAPAAKSTLINYLNEHVRFSEGVKLNRHGVRIVALLGTTGVGKTTTLAKIAAKFVLEQRTNVALITADTYRISAVEQLKTYSDILELPLEIVYNPAELTAAIERHRHKELILIDTAGRSQHNEYQMRELDEFMRVNPRIEKHLVISATTKFTDAKQIMNKFSQVNPDKIIFTKIDETGSLGMIVNLLNDNRYSLSYVTTGQSVPDDIERANAEVLTNLLLQKVEE